jgi:hypothetical protein
MGTFNASLRAIGDVKSLPATVELSDGWLSITAGETQIGSWSLDEVHLEEIPTGYRLAAEGEQILIELKDLSGFSAELASRRKRRGRVGRKKATEARSEERVTASVSESAGRASAGASRAESRPAKTNKGWTEKGLSFVDGTLEKANKRFGPYLPEWMFTRAMFAIAFGALILLIVLPGLVSTFQLIAGALLIVFGAITYSDPMLASRWLPGRTTPTHALLFGVAVLMMGVLLGVLAK